MAQTVSLVWGILAFAGMMVALLPFLAQMNWVNLPFAALGLLLSLVAIATAKGPRKGIAAVALVANGVAAAIAVIRVVLGGGIL